MSKKNLKQPTFIPMSREEMHILGWDSLDILLITGDAYVDHPAFGVALLGRWLISYGYKVGICAQPHWQNTNDIIRMGKPNLFIGVTAGSLDSQLAHYTAFRKKRSDDSYTPGGRAGARPNRASIIYSNLAKQAFPDLPIVLGGIEASLRRISHYDFWTDSLRRSILLDAKAHLLIYGMGEQAILEVADNCSQGLPLQNINGTAWIDKVDKKQNYKYLPSHEEILTQNSLLIDATLMLEKHVHSGKECLRQNYNTRDLYIAPPAKLLSSQELDSLYALPFQRIAHPIYKETIPAEEMLHTSMTSHRGCGGGCAFCSLALHQGRKLTSRSAKSLMDEAKKITKKKKFKGSISDVGGPTANMWQGTCTNNGFCSRYSCCHPNVCKFFYTPQKKYIELLRNIKNIEGIKHVRIASGIRADVAIKDPLAIRAYTEEFTGGQLKIAPEHNVPEVLKLMRKPTLNVFENFLKNFEKHCHSMGREQYVVPYLMSAYPGCTEEHMHELASWLSKRNWKPQQVQCFIPTPGTVATAMYYTGLNTQKEPIYVARTDAERLRQHRILMPNVGRISAKQGKKIQKTETSKLSTDENCNKKVYKRKKHA